MKKILFILIFCLVASASFGQQVSAQTSDSSISNLLNQLRAAINTLSAIQTQTNTAGGTTGSGSQTSTICSATVNASLLNVRSTPSVTGTLVRQYSTGQTFSILGSITGDNVEGSNKWWRTSDGYFVWAGGTTGGNNCSLSGSTTGGNTTGSGSTASNTTNNGGSNTSSLPTPGTGSGNCTILPNNLSDGMRVIAVSGDINTASVMTDNKVTAGTRVYMFSPIVEEYDGWSKVSVNGVDYPIAGPGTTPVAGQPYSTSGQNHTALNRFDVVIPSLPVPDGSDLVIKLFKMNGSNTPYIVQKTFKYYSSLTLPASDPVILPHAKFGQNYSAPLTAKCGGSVTWEPTILTGVIPKAFDIINNNLIYNPAQNFVSPSVGDIGTFLMIGKSGGSDVVQKFRVHVVSANTNTSNTNTGGTTSTSQGPTVSMVSPSTLTAAQIIFGWDINILGSGFSSSNTRVDFYQGTGLVGSATNITVSNGTSIKARVPSHLGAGAYLVQVTVLDTLAGGDATKRIITVSPF